MTTKDKQSVSTADLPKRQAVKYYEATGRRKTSVARVRIWVSKENLFLINEKDYKIYFPTKELQTIISDPVAKMKMDGKFKISVKVFGGGIHSQAEATRHGISQAIIKYNIDFRKRLKKAGFLKRDPRMKERRKFGLKKARKAPQWSKR